MTARNEPTSEAVGVDLNMILVMGVTGAGKSYFINKVAGTNATETGDRLSACECMT